MSATVTILVSLVIGFFVGVSIEKHYKKEKEESEDRRKLKELEDFNEEHKKLCEENSNLKKELEENIELKETYRSREEGYEKEISSLKEKIEQQEENFALKRAELLAKFIPDFKDFLPLLGKEVYYFKIGGERILKTKFLSIELTNTRHCLTFNKEFSSETVSYYFRNIVISQDRNDIEKKFLESKKAIFKQKMREVKEEIEKLDKEIKKMK